MKTMLTLVMLRYKALLWVGLLMVWMSCVDRIDLSLPAEHLPLIIEGQLTTDSPLVKISKAYPVDGQFHSFQGVRGATVIISDNSVDRFLLKEDIFNGGVYFQPKGSAWKAEIGHTYQLKVTLSGGARIESTLQTAVHPGSIDSIYFEYTTRENKDKSIEEEGFNIYVDATIDPGSSRRIRWRFNGTYEIFTNPSLLQIPPPCAAACQCCYCWVSESEKSPILTNPTVLGASQFHHVFIHYIPINAFTFNQRYRVEVLQMELPQDVFDFYSAMRKQIDNASSLFQPPFFELEGNMKPVNSTIKVVGVFSASAVTNHNIYINRSSIPHEVFNTEIIGDCTQVVDNSTTQVPAFWK